MALTPGTRLGPYEITAQIGVSGMGEIYRTLEVKAQAGPEEDLPVHWGDLRGYVAVFSGAIA